jgi:hypothetical protein
VDDRATGNAEPLMSAIELGAWMSGCSIVRMYRAVNDSMSNLNISIRDPAWAWFVTKRLDVCWSKASPRVWKSLA